MTDYKVGKGKCLCGSIQIVAEKMSRELDVCHCEMCRRWAGGPLMSVFCGSDLEIDGDEFLTVYDSSPWAERGFCKKCGSGLFYRLKNSGHYYVSAGIFENAEDIVFHSQIFIDKKPDYYSFANETITMTEAEVFELFAGSGSE